MGCQVRLLPLIGRWLRTGHQERTSRQSGDNAVEVLNLSVKHLTVAAREKGLMGVSFFRGGPEVGGGDLRGLRQALRRGTVQTLSPFVSPD